MIENSETESAAALAAVTAAQSSWASAYELIRPSGEIDSRAKSVLTLSLVVIALSLSSDSPKALSIVGLSLQTRGGLALGIPLIVVQMYHLAQLILAWIIYKNKISYALVRPIKAVTDPLLAKADKRTADLRQAYDRFSVTVTSRDEIFKWYWAEGRKIRESFNERKEEMDVFERITQQRKAENELEEEFRKRLRERGFDESDPVLILPSPDEDDADEMLYRDTLANLKRVARIRTLRASLDLAIPSLIAVFAVFIFTMSTVFPARLIAWTEHISPIVR